jgi:Zn finger protein HypA/HybF involved in hydrogenase expression
MLTHRKWTEADLVKAVNNSISKRQVLQKLGLVEAGGNYAQITKYILVYKINTDHFLGRGANKGRKLSRKNVYSMNEILVKNSTFQSFKLKKRLFKEKIKTPKCEICGWAKVSVDGRIPLELDHINGDHSDNRIENLRILCPNCHSLQPTHRGRNKKRG